MDGQTDRREAGKRERAGKYKKDSTKQRELWKLKPSLSLRAEDFLKVLNCLLPLGLVSLKNRMAFEPPTPPPAIM